jgi:hypothetical protein
MGAVPARVIRCGIAALALLWLGGACGSPGACASGTAKACLADGTTCACLPNCASDHDCFAFDVCVDGNTNCASCQGHCTCATSLCVRDGWNPGESLTYPPHL